MDQKTRDALEASIKHWEENVAAKDVSEVSTSASKCALCSEFLFKDDAVCVGCPVYEATGKISCAGTPYEAAVMEICKCFGTGKSISEFIKHAQAELDFLKSLRPKDEQHPVESVAQQIGAFVGMAAVFVTAYGAWIGI